jgi:hypothetical protein
MAVVFESLTLTWATGGGPVRPETNWSLYITKCGGAGVARATRFPEVTFNPGRVPSNGTDCTTPKADIPAIAAKIFVKLR